MQLPLPLRHQLFKLPILVLTLTTISFAITRQQVADTFRLHSPPDGVGGCGKAAPNGVNMLAIVETTLTDAINMAATIKQDIGSYSIDSPSSDRMRQLLYLFFGIQFNRRYQLASGSVANYNYVKGGRKCHSTGWDGDLAD